MTHSCTTKPNNQSLFWSAATADSEIDFEHLRWLHTTFPLHYSADDKRGRQVDPSDPLRAHILLNTEPDYPREHKHTQAHTQCGLEGNESKKQITRPLACGLGQVGFPPPYPTWAVCVCEAEAQCDTFQNDFETMFFYLQGNRWWTQN